MVTFSALTIISFLSQMKSEMIKSYNVAGWVVFSHEDHAYVCLPPSLLWVLAKGNWVGVNTQTAVHPPSLLAVYHPSTFFDQQTNVEHGYCSETSLLGLPFFHLCCTL